MATYHSVVWNQSDERLEPMTYWSMVQCFWAVQIAQRIYSLNDMSQMAHRKCSTLISLWGCGENRAALISAPDFYFRGQPSKPCTLTRDVLLFPFPSRLPRLTHNSGFKSCVLYNPRKQHKPDSNERTRCARSPNRSFILDKLHNTDIEETWNIHRTVKGYETRTKRTRIVAPFLICTAICTVLFYFLFSPSSSSSVWLFTSASSAESELLPACLGNLVTFVRCTALHRYRLWDRNSTFEPRTCLVFIVSLSVH